MSGGGIWEWVGGMVQGLGNVVGAGVERDASLQAIELGKQTSAEKQRRLEMEQREILGQAGAAAAASGFMTDSGSISNYLGSLKSEMDRQAEWTRAADERSLSNAKTAADWKFAGSFLSFLTMSASTMGKGLEEGRGSGPDSGAITTEYDRIWSSPTAPKKVPESSESSQFWGDFFVGGDDTRHA